MHPTLWDLYRRQLRYDDSASGVKDDSYNISMETSCGSAHDVPLYSCNYVIDFPPHSSFLALSKPLSNYACVDEWFSQRTRGRPKVLPLLSSILFKPMRLSRAGAQTPSITPGNGREIVITTTLKPMLSVTPKMMKKDTPDQGQKALLRRMSLVIKASRRVCKQ
ncbi:hypothetical protein BS47DRAFT_482798 [Hydnum rufescens UP504]|uniref:Uncharacterized protein n=1 Tax=Hydnum rufescens UP504 TaxID=1448309 RepID=A0A9P6DK51_9AGAM|nr:hypothetical protein BS47DRAFT_482798 [Hydnum rufescens UP504]